MNELKILIYCLKKKSTRVNLPSKLQYIQRKKEKIPHEENN